LYKKGILTTKSVWCFRPRGKFSGDSLEDEDYLNWILDLSKKGFEIGLHNVGDGYFCRHEILEGLEIFKSKIGYSPKVHCNHVSNPDNLYWWDRRFVWPFNYIYRVLCFIKRRHSIPPGGDVETSGCFWGDAAKNNIKYVRNLITSDLNTLNFDPKMPWHDPTKPYVDYWFSSSDGHDVKLFNDIFAPKNIDKLEKEGGACFIYTHFASGFIDANGQLNPEFKERIDDLASRQGWFVPCGVLLDYLLKKQHVQKVSYWYRLTLNFKWLVNRLKKYFIYRM